MSMKIAMIGGGWVCEARHLPALRRLPNVEVVGIVDPCESRAKALAAKFGAGHYSSGRTAAEIPWLAEANSVSISSPPAFHHAWMADCLDMGKDVLVEKPLALSRAEAADLDRRAKNGGSMIAVMHNNLFSRAAVRTREIVARGDFGAIAAVQARLLNSPRRHLPNWYESLPFGLLYDELSHFLYLGDGLGSDLRVVNASVFPSTRGNNTPALATIELSSRSFPLAFALNFESPVCEWHVSVVCEKGLLVHDVFRDVLVRIPDDREHRALDHFRTMLHATFGAWSGFVRSGWNHLAGTLDYGVAEVVRRFVSSCETRTPPDRVAWPDALRVFYLLQDCIDALEAASRKSS